MSMVNKIQSLTGGVDKLTKSADGLLATLTKIEEAAGKSITSATAALNTIGGSLNLTQGTKVPLGTDNARFSNPVQLHEPGQNTIAGSMGNFSYLSKGAVVANAVMGIGTDVVNGVLGSVPDLGTTMQNQLGYYQAALKSPGISRMSLERSTISAMKGGFSSTLGGSITAGTLANAGYSPGSSNYLQAAGEVGRAFNMLGMDNQTAATSIASMHSGAMGANLYQYGITTYNTQTGKDKTTGQIAKELMATMGGSGATTQQVRESYQKGALGANLGSMGFDQATQQMIYQAMIDISAGKNPDSNTPNKGNDNTALTAAGRMNASQAELMSSAEERMTKGFEHAADTVEAFNRGLTNVLGPLAEFQGYVGGIKGTNASSAVDSAKGIVKKVAGLAMVGGGMFLSSTGAGAAVGIPVAAAGAGLIMSGGGSNGYGAAFGKGGGKGGGSSPVSGGVTAAYGAVDTSGIWSSSNNTHTGTDYNVPVGTPVTAAMDGVISSTDLGADYGMAIMIDHDNGYQTIYAHLSEKDATVGQAVVKGQRIGKSGDTGNATGPHLHFEVRQGKNNPVNPDNLVGGSTDILNPYFASILPTQGDVTGSSSTTPGTSASVTSSTPAPKGGISANAVEMKAWLISQGFSENGAYGVVSNLLAESGLRTNASGDNDTSYGIAQWHLGRKDNLFKYAKERGLEPNSLEAQKGFLLKELGQKQYSGLMATLTNPNVSQFDATAAFLRKFERPKDQTDEAVNKRLGRGKGAMGGGGNGTSLPAVGGDSPGYGASIPAGITGGNSGNTVNVTLKIERASDDEAARFAKKVTEYIQHGTEISMMGRM